MKGFLTEEGVTALRIAHRGIKDKKLADRIKAILYLHYGYSYSEISRLLVLDEVTIRRYLDKFEEKGVDGLLEQRYHGGSSHLSILQQEALEQYLVSRTLATAQEIRVYVKKAYGKQYTLIGITKLLHRMGFTYKKPKIVPGKVSIVLQGEFLDRYKALKKTLGSKDQIYFSDATHPTHNTKPSYGWIKK